MLGCGASGNVRIAWMSQHADSVFPVVPSHDVAPRRHNRSRTREPGRRRPRSRQPFLRSASYSVPVPLLVDAATAEALVREAIPIRTALGKERSAREANLLADPNNPITPDDISKRFGEVAVKRILLPRHSTSSEDDKERNVEEQQRQALLWNEVSLLEVVRRHPHPNIVQCWGFFFFSMSALAEGAGGLPRSGPSLVWESDNPIQHADSRTSSMALWSGMGTTTVDVDAHAIAEELPKCVVLPLASLPSAVTRCCCRWSHRHTCDMGGEAVPLGIKQWLCSASPLLHAAEAVDVALSLCNGGSLRVFVRHKTGLRSHKAMCCIQDALHFVDSFQAPLTTPHVSPTTVPEAVPAAQAGSSPHNPLVAEQTGGENCCEYCSMSVESMATFTATSASGGLSCASLTQSTAPLSCGGDDDALSTVSASPAPSVFSCPLHGAIPLHIVAHLYSKWLKLIATIYSDDCKPSADQTPSREAMSFLVAQSLCSSEARGFVCSSHSVYSMVFIERELAAILIALLMGLQHVHNVIRVLHRDIKPDNVLLCVGTTMELHTAEECTSNVDDDESHEKTQVRRRGRASRRTRRLRQLWRRLSRWRTTSPPWKPQHQHLALYSDSPLTFCPPPSDQTPPPRRSLRSMVVPVDRSSLHMEFMEMHERAELLVEPQPEAWRVQLADFGLATEHGVLESTRRCGTRGYMAPEVMYCGVPRGVLEALKVSSTQLERERLTTVLEAHPSTEGQLATAVFDRYGTPADVYSLGTTMQTIVVESIVGVLPTFEEWMAATMKQRQSQHVEEVDLNTCYNHHDGLLAVPKPPSVLPDSAAQDSPYPFEARPSAAYLQAQKEMRTHRTRSLGALWVDNQALVDSSSHQGQETTDPPTTPSRSWRRTFVVPTAWRCPEELAAGQLVRLYRPRTATGVAAAAYTNQCGDEVPPHLQCLFEEEPARTRTAHGPRQRRCKSCSKLHRHLIELLNAMTEICPEDRPTVPLCLRSVALLKHGTLRKEGRCGEPTDGKVLPRRGTNPAPMRPAARRGQDTDHHHCRGGVHHDESPHNKVGDARTPRRYLWRPPSLNFLKNMDDA